jgi:hypothetical protein
MVLEGGINKVLIIEQYTLYDYHNQKADRLKRGNKRVIKK